MIAFSIESSHKRGMGHLFRSMKIANSINRKNIFFINRHTKSLNILKKNNFKFISFDTKKKINIKYLIKKFSIKLWINDKLKTSLNEAKQIVSLTKFVTFDDWGLGAKYADINISPLYFNKKKLLGKKILSGINFLPLEKKNKKYRKLRLKKKIIVSMGGSDTHSVTLKVLKELKKRKLNATIICGPSYKFFNKIKKYKNNFKIKFNVKNLIKEFSNYDILICGGGMTPFEAASVGLPSLIIANENFEIPVAKELEKLGISKYLGFHKTVNYQSIDLNCDIKKMSSNAFKKIKLKGLNKVKKNILKLLN